ncbi:MAG: tRNA preQ1(34) S-adenosylmethionine ribosyltransferase-isomerase QueA [Candidatus Cloacimonetes bacterium]|nr:tRNA preQ1(34) S-adenosylmethionine ribosyltransferase-isomerase QueA [Candidatus Cloacimonadota bacterium]
MKPDLLSKAAYHYDLPPELIAQYPLSLRDQSRLMHLNCSAHSIKDRKFEDLTEILRPGDLLVLNNSRVFPARLFGYKANGVKIQVLLLYPDGEENTWKCLLMPAKRVKQEQVLTFSENLQGRVYPDEDDDGIRRIKLSYQGDLWTEIEKIGHVPLPPYINRPDEPSDRSRYQTVYASESGSVAAPTAGLHFSPGLIQALKAKGVLFTELTLHVGIGTFRPVKTEKINEHIMHSECVNISTSAAEAVNKAKKEGRRVIAVGSTSVRSLESFWDGNKVLDGNRWTDIFIYPGFDFGVPDAIITNFHLPESTLLMMISAFAGYEYIMEAYRQAVVSRYRFFSYGDAMLIEL